MRCLRAHTPLAGCPGGQVGASFSQGPSWPVPFGGGRAGPLSTLASGGSSPRAGLPQADQGLRPLSSWGATPRVSEPWPGGLLSPIPAALRLGCEQARRTLPLTTGRRSRRRPSLPPPPPYTRAPRRSGRSPLSPSPEGEPVSRKGDRRPPPSVRICASRGYFSLREKPWLFAREKSNVGGKARVGRPRRQAPSASSPPQRL